MPQKTADMRENEDQKRTQSFVILSIPFARSMKLAVSWAGRIMGCVVMASWHVPLLLRKCSRLVISCSCEAAGEVRRSSLSAAQSSSSGFSYDLPTTESGSSHWGMLAETAVLFAAPPPEFPC